jgi:hypothetical protein
MGMSPELEDQVYTWLGGRRANVVEREAIGHVLKERDRQNGQHWLNSCPYPMRAMCHYGQTLAQLAERGITP